MTPQPGAADIERDCRQALALHQRGRWREAEVLYRQVLTLQPANFFALRQLGVLAVQTQNPAAAVALFDRASKIAPADAGVFMNLGVAQSMSGAHRAAIASFDRAIALNPRNPEAFYNRGNAQHANRDNAAAIASYDQALLWQPAHAAAHNNRALALREMGRAVDALEGFTRAVQLQPKNPEFHYNRADALRASGDLDAALASYERAIALQADHAFSHNNRGLTLVDLGRIDAAIDSYGRALAHDPTLAAAHRNRADAYRALQQYDGAVADYDRAITLNPHDAGALLNRGIALAELHRDEAAIVSFNQALERSPSSAEALNNRGLVHTRLQRVQAAIDDFDRALEVRPDYPDAHYNRGLACVAAQRLEQALDSFDAALTADPHSPRVRGVRLHTKLAISDWREVASELTDLAQRIHAGLEDTNPFFLLGVLDSPALHARAAANWAGKRYRAQVPVPAAQAIATATATATATAPAPERIRIGYFSADFHEHATMYLMAGVFESHCRARFDLTFFSYGIDSEDAMRQRVLATGHPFLQVSDRSDEDIAALARQLNIDIAVDLKGFTQDGRPGIFARHAAPLQVSYLGYPGTLGVPFIDYLIADHTVVPEGAAAHYTERVIYMPHTYQVNDAKRPIADQHFTRDELGLPAAGFVYCCFNNAFKITPTVFDSWMRILHRVPGSVLWLLASNAGSVDNLRREAEARGVDANRLVFARPLPSAAHLARQRAADVFLDTWPYNAHTTCSDALWAGLPVLTLMGESFASRVAASLLRAVGAPELITTDVAQYEARAVGLAQDGEWLAAIRRHLAAARSAAPLFDTELCTRHLEAAFTEIHERRRRGLPPDSFRVPAA